MIDQYFGVITEKLDKNQGWKLKGEKYEDCGALQWLLMKIVLIKRWMNYVMLMPHQFYHHNASNQVELVHATNNIGK